MLLVKLYSQAVALAELISSGLYADRISTSGLITNANGEFTVSNSIDQGRIRLQFIHFNI